MDAIQDRYIGIDIFAAFQRVEPPAAV